MADSLDNLHESERRKREAMNMMDERVRVSFDPNNLNQHEPGAKLDGGKPRMSLIMNGFASALYEVAQVGTYGADKYTDNGWVEVLDGVSRYTDAMYRHLLFESSETHDPESNLMHAAHAAWNALARLELMLREGRHL
jgi:hypothetical protein